MPITAEMAERRKHDIENLARSAFQIKCEPKVLLWWALFIRASVERSREWRHTMECYLGELRPSRSSKNMGLCNCGEGQVSSQFGSNKKWGKFALFVTRV